MIRVLTVLAMVAGALPAAALIPPCLPEYEDCWSQGLEADRLRIVSEARETAKAVAAPAWRCGPFELSREDCADLRGTAKLHCEACAEPAAEPPAAKCRVPGVGEGCPPPILPRPLPDESGSALRMRMHWQIIEATLGPADAWGRRPLKSKGPVLADFSGAWPGDEVQELLRRFEFLEFEGGSGGWGIGIEGDGPEAILSAFTTLRAALTRDMLQALDGRDPEAVKVAREACAVEIVYDPRGVTVRGLELKACERLPK